MSTGPEHEAYRELAEADKYTPVGDRFAAHATAALAYATLALVREQQTANLIAYLKTDPPAAFQWAEARIAIQKRLIP
jgi:hypothetical protein